MNKYMASAYTLVCLSILGYALMGFYDAKQLLFDDRLLIDQNISSLFALLAYMYVGANLFRERFFGVSFALSLSALIFAISFFRYSEIFTFEILKQLGIPFTLTLLIFFKYRKRLSDALIVKEASLAAVFWVTLRFLKFENIYNILIAVTVFCIAYYLLEMVYPLSLEVNKNDS